MTIAEIKNEIKYIERQKAAGKVGTPNVVVRLTSLQDELAQKYRPEFRKTCPDCGFDRWYIEVKEGKILFTCTHCDYRMSATYTKLEDFT